MHDRKNPKSLIDGAVQDAVREADEETTTGAWGADLKPRFGMFVEPPG